MAVERYGSKTDLVVKLILVFCVSMLSFAIGTLVGKKFSDNQHRIGQLDPETKQKTQEGSSEAAATEPAQKEKAKAGDAVSEREISKLAEEFIDDERPTRNVAAVEGSDTEEKQPSSDEMEVQKEKPAAKADADSETKKPSAKADKDSAIKVSLKKAEKTPDADLSKEVKASATGKYTVQVASYAKEDEAEGMTAELKNKGFSAFYVTAQVKGQKWYRVSVGLFTTLKEAQAYRSDLLARSKVSSAIVQKIN